MLQLTHLLAIEYINHLEKGLNQSTKEVHDLRQAQAEMQIQLKEMSHQMSRLQSHASQNTYEPHHTSQQHAQSVQGAPFNNHYSNGVPNGGSQHSEAPRTLPPLVNGASAVPSTLAPMQGIQYSDDRR